MLLVAVEFREDRNGCADSLEEFAIPAVMAFPVYSRGQPGIAMF